MLQSITSPTVSIESLTVQYSKKITALDNIDLEIKPGLFGLLGPNGAGKTTLMKVLTTLLKPSFGRVRVFDYDVQRQSSSVRKVIGFLPQEFQSYPHLSAWEALDFYGILSRMNNPKQRHEKVEQALHIVNLYDVRNRRVGKFSGGMIRRLGIAQAILADTPFLIFDEPTAGLDPKERIYFRNFIGDLSRDRIIILSTHIVEDIGNACNHLAVLDQGKIKFIGTKDDLIEQVKGKVWKKQLASNQYETFRHQYTITSRVDHGNTIEIRYLSSTPNDETSQPVDPNMEDAYLWVTGVNHHD